MAEKVFEKYHVGLGHVGSYQVSGWPYITGSTLAVDAEWKIEFPTVTKSITVIQSGSGEGRLHFVPQAAGKVVAGRHYISLEADNDSLNINVKCKEMYISCIRPGTWEVVAELTSIPTSSMFHLTGAGHTTG